MSDTAWRYQIGGQEAFLGCPLFEVLGEGGRGGGKTGALLMSFAQYVGCGFGPAWKGIIFRRTYKELRDVVDKCKEFFHRAWPNSTWNVTTMTWTWATGETLELGYMETESDYVKYHGQAFTWIGWEELTIWPDDKCYRLMMSCCRSAKKITGMMRDDKGNLIRVKLPRMIRSTTNPYGCVDEGDVLTPDGWKDIRDFRVGDSAYSFDKEGVLSEDRVVSVHAYDFEGYLVRREGRGVYMSFTDCHRLPMVNGELRRFRELPGQVDLAATISDWKGTQLTEFLLPIIDEGRTRRTKQPDRLSGLDYAELMGWFLSEGCSIDRDKAFSIAQTKLEHRTKIEALLVRCGFKFCTSWQGFLIHSCKWWSYLRQFGKCRNKFVPRSILNSEQDVLRRFFDAAVNGDGHWRSGGGSYYSLSKQLADDMAEAATKLGYRSYVSSRERKNRRDLSWTTSFSASKPIQLITGNHVYDVESNCHFTNIERPAFEGKVYCLTMELNPTFVIRQRGCTWLSGNCGHNWVKSRFKLPVPPLKTVGPVVAGEFGDRVAIRFLLEHNLALVENDPQYKQRVLEAAMNPAQRKAWDEGDWDIVAGGMFDDVWAPIWHVVPDLQVEKIPLGWRLNRSYDHGQSHPFCVLWYAESNGEPMTVDGRKYGRKRGDIYVIDEWYGSDGTPNKGLNMLCTEVADGIKSRQREMGASNRILAGPADSSIFDDFEPGKSVAGDMAKRGISWTRADKGPGSRKQGAQQIRRLLKGAIPGKEGIREEPGLHICQRCTHLLRTFPVLPRSEKDLDDVDTAAEDHGYDALRYRLREKLNIVKRGEFTT